MVEYKIGEVLPFDFTYQYRSLDQEDSTVNNLNCIRVKFHTDLYDYDPNDGIIARPLNMNFTSK